MYLAERNADGTFNIFGVHILGEMPKGMRNVPKDIDRSWMLGAIRSAQVRRNEGYKYRLHVHHHLTPNRDPQPAGFFWPKRIEEISHGGKMITALTADFVQVPAHIWFGMQAGEYPYRSIEFKPGAANAEIDSCALLTTEPPQFKFPTTTKDNIILVDVPGEVMDEAPEVGSFAFMEVGDTETALVLFSDRVSTKEEASMPKKAKLSLVPETQGADGLVPAFFRLQDEDGNVFSPASNGNPSESEFVIQANGSSFLPDLSEILALAESGSDDDDETEKEKGLKKKLAALRKRFKLAEDGSEDEGGKDDDKDPKMKANDPDVIRLQAQVDALNANEKVRTQKDEERTRLAAIDAREKEALEQLTDARVHLTDDIRKSVKLFSKSGQDEVDAYVDSMKKHADPAPVPGAHRGAPVKTVRLSGKDEEKVSSLMTEFPGQTDEVLRLSAEFEDFKRIDPQADREQFIRSNLATMEVA